MKPINFFKAGCAADVMAEISTGYAHLVFADKSKRYEFSLRELQETGTNLTFGDYGPMSEDEELTYAEVWETQQKFDHKVQRAYLEPLNNGDDDEVQK